MLFAQHDDVYMSFGYLVVPIRPAAGLKNGVLCLETTAAGA